MKKINKIKSAFNKDSNFIKTLNYIATSDYDTSYINQEKIKKINFLKWIYLILILFAIAISFLPILFGELVIENNNILIPLHSISFSILFIDYILRWITYIFRANKKSKFPLLFFPFTGISIIMVFGFLPTFAMLLSPLIDSKSLDVFLSITSSLVILQLGRLLLLLNVIPPFRMFTNIFKKQKKILIYVFLFLIIITLLFSIVIYRAEIGVEGSKILNYWDAFYFTVISICTIGYGDIVPVTVLGQVMVTILAFVGVAVFTIPSAVIAGGFLDEIQSIRKTKQENKNEEEDQNHHKVSIAEKTILKSFDEVKKISKKVKSKNKNKKISKKDEFAKDINSELKKQENNIN